MILALPFEFKSNSMLSVTPLTEFHILIFFFSWFLPDWYLYSTIQLSTTFILGLFSMLTFLTYEGLFTILISLSRYCLHLSTLLARFFSCTAFLFSKRYPHWDLKVPISCLSTFVYTSQVHPSFLSSLSSFTKVKFHKIFQ